MRPLAELTNTSDPAWPLVQKWIAAAPNAEVLLRDPVNADAALLQLQVTLRSPMGAVVHQTGGILIEHGWLRVLGAGNGRLSRSLPAWNDGKVPLDSGGRPTLLMVADDGQA